MEESHFEVLDSEPVPPTTTHVPDHPDQNTVKKLNNLGPSTTTTRSSPAQVLNTLRQSPTPTTWSSRLSVPSSLQGAVPPAPWKSSSSDHCNTHHNFHNNTTLIYILYCCIGAILIMTSTIITITFKIIIEKPQLYKSWFIITALRSPHASRTPCSLCVAPTQSTRSDCPPEPGLDFCPLFWDLPSMYISSSFPRFRPPVINSALLSWIPPLSMFILVSQIMPARLIICPHVSDQQV